MGKRKTHEEFVQEVFELVGDEYEASEEYKGSEVSIKFIHNVCNHEFNRMPYLFLQNKGCPKCNSEKANIKKTKEDVSFIREVYELVGEEYTVVGKYTGANKKVEIKHELCGNTYSIRASHFLSGNKCPHCKRTKRRKTHGQFVEEVAIVRGNIYEFLTEYVNALTKVKVKHVDCDHEWEVMPKLLTNKKEKGKIYCPNCNGGVKYLDTISFKEKIYSIVDNEYVVLGEYINANTPVKLIHNIESCMYKFKVAPSNFYNGNRCPKCSSSKGEIVVSEILNKNNEKHIPQYKFSECFYKKELPFDFAIFDNQNNLMYLIEYDGQQHFKPVDFGGKGKEWAEEQFIERKQRDQIKNTYCRENNILLYRIPYWKFDEIESILNKLINNEPVKIDENYIIL